MMENIKRISDELILEGQKETEELYDEGEKKVLEIYIIEDEFDLNFYYGRYVDMINYLDYLDSEDDEYEERDDFFENLEEDDAYVKVIFENKSLGTITKCL